MLTRERNACHPISVAWLWEGIQKDDNTYLLKARSGVYIVGFEGATTSSGLMPLFARLAVSGCFF